MYLIGFFYYFVLYIFSKRKEAGVEIEGHFMIRVIYNDDDTYALVTAASKILSKPKKFFLYLNNWIFFLGKNLLFL